MGNEVPAACTRLRAALLVISILCAASTFAATVKTDKADYAPGETVIITGAAWLPGETVKLLLQESPNISGDRTLYATADAIGNIVNKQFSPAQQDFGATFTITASGQTSGFAAQATFTDACNAGLLRLDNVAPVGSGCVNQSDEVHTDVERGQTYTLTFKFPDNTTFDPCL